MRLCLHVNNINSLLLPSKYGPKPLFNSYILLSPKQQLSCPPFVEKIHFWFLEILKVFTFHKINCSFPVLNQFPGTMRQVDVSSGCNIHSNTNSDTCATTGKMLSEIDIGSIVNSSSLPDNKLSKTNMTRILNH